MKKKEKLKKDHLGGLEEVLGVDGAAFREVEIGDGNLMRVQSVNSGASAHSGNSGVPCIHFWNIGIGANQDTCIQIHCDVGERAVPQFCCGILVQLDSA